MENIRLEKETENYIEWNGKFRQRSRAFKEDKIVGAVDTINSANIINNLRIRKLTPKECWRLMGFDDSDFEKAEKVNSNTQLYKQAGNSIVVNVLETILKNLIKE